MSYDISLLLDGLILVFLCVTIFYAARLSLFMKSFREGRSEMQRLIRDLNSTIEKAETSVAIMKDNATSTQGAVENVISEAKFLSDELKFMTETGDSLADRLEKLADRNRELVDLMESSGGIGTQKVTSYDFVPSKKSRPAVQNENTFEIDDFDLDSMEMDEDDEFDFMALGDGAYREEDAVEQFEEDIDHQSKVNTEAKSKVRSFAIFDRDYESDFEEAAPNDQYEPIDGESFHSRAEQDLYEALQRKKKAYDKSNKKSKKVSKIS